MDEELKLKELKTKDVEKFLKQTGFIFEMQIAEILKKQGYAVKANQMFLDLEESKKREIDIVAEKVVNKIKLVLIIECKQSLRDSWIFINSEKLPGRYYYAIKHFPQIFSLPKSKVFNDTHMMDKSIPVAKNYIVIDKHKNKKSEALQIDECIKKLPKALIGIAAGYGKTEKTIYIPIVIFSDQFFTATYEDELKVQEESLVQYQIDFESKFYKKKGVNRLLGQVGSVNESLYSLDDININLFTLNKILDCAQDMKIYFLIDFVNKKGLEDYLKRVEKGIGLISPQKWSRNLPKVIKPPKF